jgi:hypothetical protein
VEHVEIEVAFNPSKLRAFAKNEAQMSIVLKNLDAEKTYWSECEVVLAPPLSLSHDSELNMGRTRIGILKPTGTASKQVKLYTRPNNYPDNYNLAVTAYVYDEDGAIAERVEKKIEIQCITEEKVVSERDNSSLAPPEH